MIATAFRFDARSHEYLSPDTGEVYPHITGMLKAAGLVDDRWYTDASRERGSGVHKLTADYDRGFIPREEVPQVDSPYKGWLQAHVAACDIVQPSWSSVEVALLHPEFRYGGRPDRAGLVYGARAVVEIKSGDPEPAHAIQLALQAMLLASVERLPAESIQRYAMYLKGNGRFKFHHFPNHRDFAEARRIIRTCCG